MGGQTLGQRLWNFWYVAVCAVVIGWMWISLAGQVGDVVAAVITSQSELEGLLAATSLLILALVAWAVSFCGPARASVGELTWYPQRDHTARQRLQIGLVVLALVAILGCIIAAVALRGGLQIPTLVGIAATILGGAGILFAGGTWLQTRDASWVGEAAAFSLVVLSLAVLVGTALTIPILIAALVGAMASVLLVLLQRSLRRSPRRSRRPALQAVPAWDLTRADANVSAAQLALTDLDYRHLRGVVDARSMVAAKRPIRALRSTSSSLFSAVLLRSLGGRWHWLVALPVLSVSLGAIGGVQLGQFAALAGAVLLAVQNAAIWVEWTSSAALSRAFAVTSRHSGGVVFAALCVAPVLVALLGSAVQGIRVAALCAVLALVAAAYTMLARARSASNNRRSGPMGTVLFLPDLGYLPLGIIGRILSGWVISLAAVGVGVAFGLQGGIALLAVLMGISVVPKLPRVLSRLAR